MVVVVAALCVALVVTRVAPVIEVAVHLFVVH